jgi:hypothetical protein
MGESANVRRDEELGGYLGKVIQEKETSIDNLKSELAIAFVSNKPLKYLFRKEKRT